LDPAAKPRGFLVNCRRSSADSWSLGDGKALSAARFFAGAGCERKSRLDVGPHAFGAASNAGCLFRAASEAAEGRENERSSRATQLGVTKSA